VKKLIVFRTEKKYKYKSYNYRSQSIALSGADDNKTQKYKSYPVTYIDQTFALVLVPALTKMGDTFCGFFTSAVAPL
jgi:hypothetical protein